MAVGFTIRGLCGEGVGQGLVEICRRCTAVLFRLVWPDPALFNHESLSSMQHASVCQNVAVSQGFRADLLLDYAPNQAATHVPLTYS